jgi:hypothetical protein
MEYGWGLSSVPLERLSLLSLEHAKDEIALLGVGAPPSLVFAADPME